MSLARLCIQTLLTNPAEDLRHVGVRSVLCHMLCQSRLYAFMLAHRVVFWPKLESGALGRSREKGRLFLLFMT